MKGVQVAKLLAEAVSYSGGTAYYVGGYVRDKLLGIASKDIDIEVHGISTESLEHILKSFGEFDKVGKCFGVYKLKYCDLDISLPRVEVKTGEKHTDFDVQVKPFIGTYAAASRRDFTINSIMENVLTGETIDHFNGVADLNLGVLRHVDSNTFKEDPLRVLRAAQFAARFEFAIDSSTIELAQTIELDTLSPERVFEELKKVLLKSRKPSIFFTELHYMGHLSYWFKELEGLRGIPQNRQYHQEGDAWMHTMMVLDTAATHDPTIRNPLGFMLSALCHDFGKAVSTESDKDNIIHSISHEVSGLPLVETFLRRITNETKLIKYVLNMVELHMAPNIMFQHQSRIKKTNKLFDKSVEPYDLIQLCICDNLGRIPYNLDIGIFLLHRYEIFNDIMNRPFVQGRDLVALGYKPSAKFSEVLRYAHKLRLAGVTKDSALKQVKSYAKGKLEMIV